MAKLISTGSTDERAIIERLQEEGYCNIFKWRDSAGTRYPTHTHPHYEVRWILDGILIIEEEGVTLTLRPGDRMESLPQTPHSAYAPEDVCYICASR